MRDLITELTEPPKKGPGSIKTLKALADHFDAKTRDNGVYGASANWTMDEHSAAKARSAVKKVLKGLGCKDFKDLKMMGASQLLTSCLDRSGDQIVVTFKQSGQKRFGAKKTVYTARISAEARHNYEGSR